MSDIYGRLIEMPDGKLMVEIKPHDYEKPMRRRVQGRLVTDPFCRRCGFHRVGKVHPNEVA